MSRDKRTGWLRDLRVGDKVWAPRVGRSGFTQTTVIGISPTGIIGTYAGDFDPDGRHRPQRGYGSHGRLLSDAEKAGRDAFEAERPERITAIRKLEATSYHARLRTLTAAQWVLDHPEAVERIEALMMGEVKP